MQKSRQENEQSWLNDLIKKLHKTGSTDSSGSDCALSV